MEAFTGNLVKMKSQIGLPVQYYLPFDGQDLPINKFIGHQIKIEYLNEINCISCGAVTKSSFFQGYCFTCFSTLPETDSCVMQPETCRAHEGISRDMEWSKGHCLTDHIVYLALTSNAKVGVTRASQIPARWIDQGAWKVIVLARTPNRFLAGLIEVELKKNFTDKTSWQKMLKDVRDPELNLLEEKNRAWDFLPEDLEQYCIEDDTITEIHYPVSEYPDKVKSTTFDKQGLVEGVLAGIRGQYLIFQDKQVLNIRRHSGYKVKITMSG
jgi:hypothetical protein